MSKFLQFYLPHSVGCHLTATRQPPADSRIQLNSTCAAIIPTHCIPPHQFHFCKSFRAINVAIVLFIRRMLPGFAPSRLLHIVNCLHYIFHSLLIHTCKHIFTLHWFLSPIFATQFCHLPVKRFARTLTKPQYHVYSVILRFRLNVTWQRCGASQYGFNGYGGYCK